MLTGGLACAAAVLAPYQGLGLPDAIWAGLAGGSAALTWWRWSDLRALRQLPLPPTDPYSRRGDAWLSWAAKLPVGREAVAELMRYQAKGRIRGSAAAPAWKRLDTAVAALAGLAPRLAGAGGPTAGRRGHIRPDGDPGSGPHPVTGVLGEAAAAEQALRDLGERIAAVERAMGLAGTGDQVQQAHARLLEQFTEGVEAYERMVGAVAAYVAQDSGGSGDPAAVGRLREAADLLTGLAAGLAELRVAG